MLEVKDASGPASSWAAFFWIRFQRSGLLETYRPQIDEFVREWPKNEGLIIDFLCLFIGLWVGLKLSAPMKKWWDERPAQVRFEVPDPAKTGYIGPILENPSITSKDKPGFIQCYDPATGYHLADVQADTPETIDAKIQAAKKAQEKWKTSSFAKRRFLMSTIQKWVVDECETITRVAARDTGKTVSSLNILPLDVR
jgi:Aldehyde dehydrogenase family